MNKENEMKKIMMATALAAFCGAVMADAIESANIVGYETETLNKGGFTGLGNAFVTPSQTGLKVSSLKPEGYLAYLDPDEMADFTSINFQIIDKDGRGVKTYVWTHEFDWGEMGYVEGTGYWADANSGEIVVADGLYDWTIPAGQGLLWNSPDLDESSENSAKISFVDSGEVYKATVPVTLNKGGFTMVANPYPTGVKISTIVPTGYLVFLDPDEMSDFTSINFQVIDKDGRGIKTYVWTHEFDWGEMGYVEGAGYWADANSGEVVVADGPYDWAVPAGQGLLFDSPDLDEENENSAKISFSFYYPL